MALGGEAGNDQFHGIGYPPSRPADGRFPLAGTHPSWPTVAGARWPAWPTNSARSAKARETTASKHPVIASTRPQWTLTLPRAEFDLRPAAERPPSSGSPRPKSIAGRAGKWPAAAPASHRHCRHRPTSPVRADMRQDGQRIEQVMRDHLVPDRGSPSGCKSGSTWPAWRDSRSSLSSAPAGRIKPRAAIPAARFMAPSLLQMHQQQRNRRRRDALDAGGLTQRLPACAD